MSSEVTVIIDDGTEDLNLYVLKKHVVDRQIDKKMNIFDQIYPGTTERDRE